MPVPVSLHQRPASFYKVFNPPLKFTFFSDSGEAYEAIIDLCIHDAREKLPESFSYSNGFTHLGLHVPSVISAEEVFTPDELNRLWNDALAAVDYYLNHLKELEGTPDPEQVPSNEQ